MSEENEAKLGGRVSYKVDDKTLILEPIPFKRLSKLLTSVVGLIKEFSSKQEMSNEDYLERLPGLVEDHGMKILPLLFSPKKHAFINKEWIEENMTLPVVVDIFKQTIVINGLQDFLGKKAVEAGVATPPVEPTKPVEPRSVTMTEIPPVLPGSTTSSALPTSGQSKT